MTLLVQIIKLFAFLIAAGATAFYLDRYLLASPEECIRSSAISCTPDTYFVPLLAWGMLLIVIILVLSKDLLNKIRRR